MSQASFPLDPIEKASIDELRALQLKRLQATLQHAYANSPAYRAKFDAAGVHPDHCKSLKDLAKFPFTTKTDLRAHYPFGMFAVPREKLARVHASSGTTGKPTVVGYTLQDIDMWAQCVARSIRAAGARHVRDRGRLLGERVDAAIRRHAALEDIDHPAERDHGPVEHGQIPRERHELPERDVPAHDLAPAEPDREQCADPDPERERGLQHPRGVVVDEHLAALCEPREREYARHIAARHGTRGRDDSLLAHRAGEAHFVPASERDGGPHGAGRPGGDPRDGGHALAHVLSGFFLAAGNSTLFRISR